MRKKEIVILIFATTIILVSSLDIYIPVSPQLAQIFGVPESLMKLTFLIGPLTSALVGMPVGFLADRYGRRPLLIVGILCYWVGTFTCTTTLGITGFLLGRFLQSLGVGTLMILNHVILADLFSGTSLARTIGLFALLFPFAFALAPIVGAQLFTVLGWRAMFGSLLAAFTPLALLLFIFLPETQAVKEERPILPLLKELASSRLVLALAITHSLPITVGAMFTANGAFLYQSLYHFEPVAFSIVQAIPVTVQCLGTLLYRQIVTHTGLHGTLKIGFKVAAIYSLICVLMIWNVLGGPWFTVGAICFFTLGATFIITSASTLLLDSSEGGKGLSASFLSLVRNLVISTVISGASFLPHHSLAPIFSAMLLVSLATCFFVHLSRRELLRREPVQVSQ